MKRVYWRPPSATGLAHTLIALVSLVCFLVCEIFLEERRQEHYTEKVQASQLAKAAMAEIRREKASRGLVMDPESDPAGTGLVGPALTPITSNTGFLESKQTSLNPNFAAVILEMLKSAGVREGDVVAVGVSGSFPGANLAVYSALQVLRTRPIVIASAASSQWGATDPEYLWIDMEKTLQEKGLIAFGSVGASRGGIDDRGFGIIKTGRSLLDEAIRRHGLVPIVPNSLQESIELRMQLYLERAGGAPIKAYVNVGGGSASVGTFIGKKLFKPGVNLHAPRGAIDSVLLRFSQEGVPVIHLTNIKKIAARYGLPIAPRQMPAIGQGSVFVRRVHNEWLVAASILIISLTMIAFLRLDLGHRILRNPRPESAAKVPQRMA